MGLDLSAAINLKPIERCVVAKKQHGDRYGFGGSAVIV